MAWLQNNDTIRLHHRHTLFEHVFSGRYIAQLVEDSGNGYLCTACDYVHLNPVRVHLVKPLERLLTYPWSSQAMRKNTVPDPNQGRLGYENKGPILG